MTIICLHPPLDLLSPNDKGHRMTIICLCAFITRLDKSKWQRAQNLSLRVYHSTRCSWMTKGVEFVFARLSLNLLLLNVKGHRICLCAFITQLAKSEWQRAQNLSLRIYHSTRYSRMTKGAEFDPARLSLIERADNRMSLGPPPLDDKRRKRWH